MKKIIFWLWLCCTALVLAADTRFSAEQYLAHVRYLASDELKGRGNNQPELEKAADYIEHVFRRSGVKAFPSLGGYRQFFEITAEIKVGTGSELRVGERVYQLDKDFSLLSFSDLPAGRSEAVFCGYGIVSADGGYDDYAGKEVEGKVAVVLDGSPQLPQKEHWIAPLADVMSKIVTAKHRKVAALVIVRDPRQSSSRAAERMGIPAFAASPGLASALLGVTPDQFGDPRASFTPASLAWNLQVEEKRKKVANVVGYVAPRRLPDEWVVVGAHYDHLGLGEKFALDPSAIGQPHKGADDNASGTAGVLTLARGIVKEASHLRRGVILVTFAGEELGLLGSAYFVRHVPSEVPRVIAMINMDMIGRSQGKVYLGGVGSAREFGELVKDFTSPLKVEKSLKVEASQSSLGGSDHMSFTQRGIPALFFFSGLHTDYHKATDDWQKINSESAVQILELVRQVVDKLAASTTELHFVQVAEPRPVGDGSGYGAYFGSVPDFAQEIKGVRFADVRADSPASKAGLQAGDVLVKFAGAAIENLYDFTVALRTHAPGQVIEVECIRGTQTVRAQVTLEARR
ncbi:MAG: M28 family peptidase [Acidobacteria bacterium]|nr:M28 family peptidase [Acidobacteriota bacterium]